MALKIGAPIQVRLDPILHYWVGLTFPVMELPKHVEIVYCIYVKEQLWTIIRKLVAADGNAPPPSGSKPDGLTFIRSGSCKLEGRPHWFSAMDFQYATMGETCTRCIFHASPDSWLLRFPLSTNQLVTSHVVDWLSPNHSAQHVDIDLEIGQDLIFRGHLRSPQPKTHEGLLMFLVRHPTIGWRYTQ